MSTIGKSLLDIGYMEVLAAGTGPLHRLDPRAKLLTTLVFIITVVSFDKYALCALIPFFLYPVFLIAAGGLDVGYLMKKVLVISPFAIVVGIFNPVMDRTVLFHLGSLDISGGWVSFLSILLRFILTVSAALTLVSLTGFNAVCAALMKLRVPRVFVIQLLFLYRYVFVLTEEAERAIRAVTMRAFSSKAMAAGTFVSLLGHLLVRTLDRAERIYRAMYCRGFDGHIHIMRSMRIGFKEFAFMSGWTLVFVLLRWSNIPLQLGTLITGVLS